MINLNNKRALVTGGAMGIGRETVELLLKEGCHVIVWDLQEKALEALSNDFSAYKEQLTYAVVDISNKQTVYEQAKSILAIAPLDILVNNAGVMRPGTFLEGSDEDWELTMKVNFNSILYTTRAFLPSMNERNTGHIVNISSAAGLLGVSGLAVYAGSKWAVLGLTNSLREENWMSRRKVRFSTVHPFYVATGLFEGAQIKGLGNLLVPRVKNHRVIAKAIVYSALKRGKKKVYRPRSLFLIDLLRGLLPFSVYVTIMRWLRVQQSMDHHKGHGGHSG